MPRAITVLSPDSADRLSSRTTFPCGLPSIQARVALSIETLVREATLAAGRAGRPLKFAGSGHVSLLQHPLSLVLIGEASHGTHESYHAGQGSPGGLMFLCWSSGRS